ncbi:DNA-dependent metalloprotease dvc-1-like isoform X1 [Leptopilina heterotoma]|uniref:DNA-dependent metalloprotease dvc-1-like isoform X1 n=2 Tax=Leptopilina heterotoma TaxID=63436 RepID=UPI001CA819BC|nr:DNA-dependent metalloprotease dvc-1-like isoform X1 [Leptopilina heterotoma]
MYILFASRCILNMSERVTRSQKQPLEPGLKLFQRKRATDGRPDLKGLYDHLDEIYFNNELANAGYTFHWGPKMPSASGCTDLPRREVRINWEVHSMLPEEDLIGTMLHEMIHVKLFRERKDFDSLNHTEVFQREVDRINAIGPYRADIIHHLPQRVTNQLYPYVWRCTSCTYKLRLSSSLIPGPRYVHFVRGQKVCDNPLWVKVK